MDINFNELLKVKPKKEKPTFLNVISCGLQDKCFGQKASYQ